MMSEFYLRLMVSTYVTRFTRNFPNGCWIGNSHWKSPDELSVIIYRLQTKHSLIGEISYELDEIIKKYDAIIWDWASQFLKEFPNGCEIFGKNWTTPSELSLILFSEVGTLESTWNKFQREYLTCCNTKLIHTKFNDLIEQAAKMMVGDIRNLKMNFVPEYFHDKLDAIDINNPIELKKILILVAADTGKLMGYEEMFMVITNFLSYAIAVNSEQSSKRRRLP